MSFDLPSFHRVDSLLQRDLYHRFDHLLPLSPFYHDDQVWRLLLLFVLVLAVALALAIQHVLRFVDSNVFDDPNQCSHQAISIAPHFRAGLFRHVTFAFGLVLGPAMTSLHPEKNKMKNENEKSVKTMRLNDLLEMCVQT